MTIIDLLFFTTLGFMWGISPMTLDAIRGCYEKENDHAQENNCERVARRDELPLLPGPPIIRMA